MIVRFLKCLLTPKYHLFVFTRRSYISGDILLGLLRSEPKYLTWSTLSKENGPIFTYPATALNGPGPTRMCSVFPWCTDMPMVSLLRLTSKMRFLSIRRIAQPKLLGICTRLSKIVPVVWIHIAFSRTKLNRRPSPCPTPLLELNSGNRSPWILTENFTSYTLTTWYEKLFLHFIKAQCSLSSLHLKNWNNQKFW